MSEIRLFMPGYQRHPFLDLRVTRGGGALSGAGQRAARRAARLREGNPEAR
jgi:hypothetical protein